MVKERAEEAARKQWREKFDVVTARALARLNVLSELCLPFVKVGGTFVSLKGPDVAEEVKEGEAAVKKLGGKIERIEKIRKEDISTVEFSIEDKSFKLIHFKNYNPNSSIHCINLCANDRRVSSTNLQSVFSGVNSKFVNTDGSFVYNGYITSDYLDENVNRERTAFNIDETQRSLFSQVTKSEIVSKATELVFAYLKDELIAYNEKKREKIERFIRNVNPRYRLLLRRYPECIDNIMNCLSKNSSIN